MKVLITQKIPEIGLDILKKNNIDFIIPNEEDHSKEEWKNYFKDVDAVLNVGKHTYDKTFFETYPNIKAIVLFSVGYDQVDIKEATKRKIPVSNTPDVLSRATSDIAFLLMQMVARKASYNIQKVKLGHWQNFDATEQLGQELYGKTLGIYGLGRIGLEMAKKCKSAFDMDIIYHNRKNNKDAEDKLDAKLVSFDELISRADVLSVHANYTPEQKGLFSKQVFEKMKSNSIFINTARGSFHQENDLLEALRNQTIWGAGLDVTNPEPMAKENPLLLLPNVCVLPHIGSATIEARNGMARLSAENIVAFALGKAMPNAINPEVYNNH